MKTTILLLLLGATFTIASQSNATSNVTKPPIKPITQKDVYQPATIELFGNKVALPEWMDRMRISVSNFLYNVKKFFNGEFQISTEAFGKKVSFRTNIPDTKEELTKSVSKFFSNVHKDSTTRLFRVIFVTYTLFFIKQVQLHRRQKREEKLAKKQRKQDEEERRWLIPGDPLDDIPILSNGPSLASFSKVVEEMRGNNFDASLFEQKVQDEDATLHLEEEKEEF